MDHGYFIPDKDEHIEIVEQIRSILSENTEMKTPEIVDEIECEYSDGYLRTLVGYIRKWMEERDEIEVEWDETGSGQPHAIWSEKS